MAVDFMFPIAILASGLILIFSLSKEHKVFHLAGGYFLVLGGWLLADRLVPEAKVFGGGWGIAFRCITAAVLAVMVVVFVKEYRKKGKGASPENSSQKGKPSGDGADEEQF